MLGHHVLLNAKINASVAIECPDLPLGCPLLLRLAIFVFGIGIFSGFFAALVAHLEARV